MLKVLLENPWQVQHNLCICWNGDKKIRDGCSEPTVHKHWPLMSRNITFLIWKEVKPSGKLIVRKASSA